MKRSRIFRRRGAVVVMVTLSIIMLMAITGLVVDIGWAYFVRRAAQVAADAAAQAGAKYAFEQINLTQPINDGTAQTIAIEYAKLNGFTTGGGGGRQTVEIASSSDKSLLPAQLQPLLIRYWVQAKVKSTVPAFFMPGSAGMNSGAVAIAAVLLEPLSGSVYLLNQTCNPDGTSCNADTVPKVQGLDPGVDLFLQGNTSVLTAPRGIQINSSANGDNRTSNKYALMSNGGAQGGQIQAPYIQFALDGSFQGKPDPAINGLPPTLSAHQVPDPTLALDIGRQPRVKTVDQMVFSNPYNPGQVVYGVTAQLQGTPGKPVPLFPGVYVNGTVTPDGSGGQKFVFSNQPVSFGNNVQFVNPSTTEPGTYIFLGGITMKQADVTLAPGMYVLAGGPNGTTLNIETSRVVDNGGGNFGELFLLTKPDYRPDFSTPPSATNQPLLGSNAMYTVLPLGSDGQPFAPQIKNTSFAGVATYPFGNSSIQSGTGNGQIQMNGVKRTATCFPGECPPDDTENSRFQPALIWQDRRNPGCVDPTLLPCPSTDASGMSLQAAALAGMMGLIYQPRGGWLELQGGPGGNAKAQVITGAMKLAGTSSVTLPKDTPPTLVLTVSLIR